MRIKTVSGPINYEKSSRSDKKWMPVSNNTKQLLEYETFQ